MPTIALIALLLSPFAQPNDTNPAAAALAARIAQAQRTCPDTPAARTNLAIARLDLKKARLIESSGTIANGDKVMPLLVGDADAALKRIADGKPFEARPGQLNELAYIAQDDGSVQPYYLYLPRDYDPAKKWPLIVFLHGYVPSITVLDPWIPWKEVLDVVDKAGCMMVVPYGRRNTDFQGVGEVDVLKTISLVRRDYPVDPDRVYMTGVSMGGMGAWNMALRHPGMFAATALMCGQTDMIRWWGWDKQNMAPFKRWLMLAHNPIDLVMNALNEPFSVEHGSADPLVPVDQSRTMVAKMKSLGLSVVYKEWPGQGHTVYFLTAAYALQYQWLIKHKLDPGPLRVDYKTFSLTFDRAWWTRIDRFDAWGKPAILHAKMDAARNSLDVSAQNIAQLSINARDARLVAGAKVKINGASMKAVKHDGDWLTYVLSPLPAGANAFPGIKRKGLCGPVQQAFNTPFILVQGTAGDTADDERLAAAVGTWATDWDGFCDGYPRVTTDEALSANDIARYNLVLFGTPKTNSVLARIAPKLPIQIGDHSYKIGARTFSGPDLGLVMCYPDPLAPSHYVAIYSGSRYGKKLSINHKHDLLPDFVVFHSGVYDYDDVDKWVCGGLFDTSWRLNPATTWVRGTN